MSDNPFNFHSALAGMLTGFVLEKRAMGYTYDSAAIRRLRILDRFFCSAGSKAMPNRSLGQQFLASHRNGAFWDTRQRGSNWRQFAEYCQRQGLEAWVPDRNLLPIYRSDFCPFIYTRPQIASLLATIDALPHLINAPRRTANYSLLFRLLYGAGLRIGETLALCIGDCDQEAGVLRICQGKNRKDRLIPLVPKLADRVAAHIRRFPGTADTPLFLSSKRRHAVDVEIIEDAFRITILPRAGLPPRKDRKGPRIHDLRHTFAVHRLENWFRAGENVEAKLPYLAAYMGHTNIRDTYYYLRITQSFFPEIVSRLEAAVGDVIPQMENQP